MIDTKKWTQIGSELSRIEREENVKILYACESGRRAWGFPSKDSDYDVRFLYIRPMEWYLKVHPGRDVIERPISDSLDLSGWDLRKALQLLAKSNPPLLEWLNSPICYLERGTVIDAIREASPELYSPKSCLHHYLSLATGNFRTYLQSDRVRLKKYFYVLRSTLACQWLEERGSIPPVEFQQLTDALLPEGSELKQVVNELLLRKRNGEELDNEPPIPILHNYLAERLAYYTQLASELPAVAGPHSVQLDDWFLSALRENWSFSVN